jgi:hypothetical protein
MEEKTDADVDVLIQLFNSGSKAEVLVRLHVDDYRKLSIEGKRRLVTQFRNLMAIPMRMKLMKMINVIKYKGPFEPKPIIDHFIDIFLSDDEFVDKWYNFHFFLVSFYAYHNFVLTPLLSPPPRPYYTVEQLIASSTKPIHEILSQPRGKLHSARSPITAALLDAECVYEIPDIEPDVKKLCVDEYRLMCKTVCVTCARVKSETKVICPGCERFVYCSPKCQEADKEEHKLICGKNRTEEEINAAIRMADNIFTASMLIFDLVDLQGGFVGLVLEHNQ